MALCASLELRHSHLGGLNSFVCGELPKPKKKKIMNTLQVFKYFSQSLTLRGSERVNNNGHTSEPPLYLRPENKIHCRRQ